MAFIGVFLIAMIGSAILIFLALMFVEGILNLIGSIVMASIFTKKHREGKRYGKPWMIVSYVIMGLSVTMMLPLSALFIYGVASNSQVPDGFIDGEEIKKDGNVFYTDDTRYVSTGYEVIWGVTPTYTGDYYAYKPEGFLGSKADWCDIKLFETESGYDMFSYDGNVYVNLEEFEDVKSYYDNEYQWYHDSMLLSDEDGHVLDEATKNVSTYQDITFSGMYCNFYRENKGGYLYTSKAQIGYDGTHFYLLQNHLTLGAQISDDYKDELLIILEIGSFMDENEYDSLTY